MHPVETAALQKKLIDIPNVFIYETISTVYFILYNILRFWAHKIQDSQNVPSPK